MALHHADSGEVVPLSLPDSDGSLSRALIKTAALEVILMHLAPDKHIPQHQVPGEITIQCLQGEVQLTLAGRAHTLRAQELIHVAGAMPYAISATAAATLLLTILLAPK